MLRVISEIRPSFVLAENVRGAVNLALDTVYSGMVGEGYKVYPYVIPASAVGAPHQRERLFVIGVRKDVADCASKRLHVGFSEESFECGGENGRYISVEGSGFGLWPTPSVHGNYNRAGVSDKSGNGLSTAVKLCPTPTVGTSGGGKLCGGTGHLTMLRDALSYEEARKLSAVNGGKLSPDWVSLLMGFPIGWTDLDCDEPEPWPGWPALMGEPQFDYEPPRTVTKCADRAKRLKCLGNAVVPQQALPLFEAIAIMDMVSSTVRKREEEDGKNGS